MTVICFLWYYLHLLNWFFAYSWPLCEHWWESAWRGHNANTICYLWTLICPVICFTVIKVLKQHQRSLQTLNLLCSVWNGPEGWDTAVYDHGFHIDLLYGRLIFLWPFDGVFGVLAAKRKRKVSKLTQLERFLHHLLRFGTFVSTRPFSRSVSGIFLESGRDKLKLTKVRWLQVCFLSYFHTT